MPKRSKPSPSAQRKKKERQPLYGLHLTRLRKEYADGVTYLWYRDKTVRHLVLGALAEKMGGTLAEPHNPEGPIPEGDRLALALHCQSTGESVAEVAVLRTGPEAQYAQNALCVASFQAAFGEMLNGAQVYVARDRQLDQFHGIVPPRQPLRLPFPDIWLEFEHPRDLFPGSGAESPRKPANGVLISLRDHPGGGQTLTMILLNEQQFAVSVHAARDQLTFADLVDIDPVNVTTDDIRATLNPQLRRQCEEVFNFLYLVQADNVRTERVPASNFSLRSNDRKRLHHLPVTHHLLFTDTHNSPHSAAQGAGSSHTVRYDVAGHWRTYTKGRDEPRRVWIHPHQRGLASDVYRPRNRAMRGDES